VMKFEALIFDMDGLMVDTERLYFEAEREIAKRFGRTIKDETLWKMMGRKPIESMEIFATDLKIDKNPQELLAIRDEIMKSKLSCDLRPMPGLDFILNEFHGKLKLALATGAKKDFMDIIIDGLGIRKFFDFLLPSDNINHGKPHPEIYTKACRSLNLPPENCIVLEDSQNGVIAGKDAGSTVIAIPSDYSRHQDFSRADFIVKDLFEAAETIKNLLLSGK